MAQLLIRNVSDEVVAALKKQAKENGRSLEAEVRKIVEDSTREDNYIEGIMRFRELMKDRETFDSTLVIRDDRDSR